MRLHGANNDGKQSRGPNLYDRLLPPSSSFLTRTFTVTKDRTVRAGARATFL